MAEEDELPMSMAQHTEQSVKPIKFWSSDQSKDSNYLQSKIIKTIRDAKNCICVQVYKFSSEDVKDELVDARRRKCTVKVLLDKKATKGQQKDIANSLHREGIDVRLDADCKKAHVKVLIIDKKVVLTGSYNLVTRPPLEGKKKPRLDNLVEIHDEQVAQQFLEVFYRHWEKGLPYKGGKPN